jgi:predicted Zn-dependent protease
MRLNLARKLTVPVLSGTLAILALNVADAALWVSEKEIERKYRVEWLSMKKHVPIHPDQRVQKYVMCVAQGIIATLDDSYKQLDWEVIVFDDPQKNAQVMPGGKVAIYSGILEVADTPDALAAVIGHEAAHLTEGHVLERERRAAQTQALTVIGNAATGLGGMVSDAATLGLLLPFTRGQETESDAVGMHYMAKAGYDPRATLYLWRNMASLEGSARAPEFASTHPAPETRMSDLVPHLTEALKEYNAIRESGVRPRCGM